MPVAVVAQMDRSPLLIFSGYWQQIKYQVSAADQDN
jgi:hypothetical protein